MSYIEDNKGNRVDLVATTLINYVGYYTKVKDNVYTIDMDRVRERPRHRSKVWKFIENLDKDNPIFTFVDSEIDSYSHDLSIPEEIDNILPFVEYLQTIGVNVRRNHIEAYVGNSILNKGQ